MPPFEHSAFKSKGGLARIWAASTYSLKGLQAAFKHEAAFRQEFALGLPLILIALWLAANAYVSAFGASLMISSIVLVWLTELLNSAIEAVADAVSVEPHPLLGRAKDLGSAAVFCALCLVVVVWVGVLLRP